MHCTNIWVNGQLELGLLLDVRLLVWYDWSRAGAPGTTRSQRRFPNVSFAQLEVKVPELLKKRNFS